MGLKEYKNKRVFSKTPEPDTPPVAFESTQHRLRFVVQKHAASRLHYDFRLEMAGVLKSWAVPKGPSLNPNDKRLAIMVEDHPYNYKDFEGIIPKGNYGAGRVIIWDEGNYNHVDEDSGERALLQGLKKGHLHFILHGKKLHGEFNLVRLNDQRQKNAWLLMKVADKFASAADILKKATSVRSQLSIEQMTEDATVTSKKKLSTDDFVGAIKRPMPEEIRPMLATLVDKSFSDPAWGFEIKWDGYRIIAFINNKKVELISRDQQDYTNIYSVVARELSQLKIKAIVDGEMVVVDESGSSHFRLIQQYYKSQQGTLIYYIFDILWCNGYDLRKLPFYKRKQLLEKIITPSSHVQLSEHIVEDGEEFFDIALSHHLEGIMAKRLDSHYEAGHRSVDWLKIKFHHQQEAVICGYTAPRGSRKHIGALVLGVYDRGHLIYIGHTAGKLNAELLKDLKQRLDRLSQPQSPIHPVPKTNAAVTWVKPQLVCEVKFSEWTEDGRLRQPIFLGLRPDKLARSVRREKELPLKKVVKKSKKPSKNSTKTKQPINTPTSAVDNKNITINQQNLNLTHLDKLYWPKEGYTKGDLIAYYLSIAKFILPYLKNRPQSLNRHPNGINGENFFQKNHDKHPEWVMTHMVHSDSESRDVEYLLCQNAATLVYMVNLGCIEINPWLSRIPSLDKPDFCVIDLDPEDIEFTAVVKTAQAVHRLLDDIGAANYCKTSGASGLHVCIPLGRKYDYEQSKQFAQLIATVINNQLPKITSIVRSPRQRQGKVYLDFLQNRRGQTLVAPYCVRPRLGATVSTPLHWEEVTHKLTPQQFTINNIKQRIEKYGDLWKPVLGKGINLQQCLKKLQTLMKL